MLASNMDYSCRDDVLNNSPNDARGFPPPANDVWTMRVQEHQAMGTSTNIFTDRQWHPQTLPYPNVPGPSRHTFNWPPYRIAAEAQQFWSRFQAHDGASRETPLELKRRKNREAAARCQQRKKQQLEQLREDVTYLRDLVTRMKQEKRQLHVLEIRSKMKDS